MISDVRYLIQNDYYDTLWSEKQEIKDPNDLKAYLKHLEEIVVDEEEMEIDTLYFHLTDLSKFSKVKKLIFKTKFLNKIEKFPPNVEEITFKSKYPFDLPNVNAKINF